MKTICGTITVLVWLIAAPAFAQATTPLETGQLERVGEVLLVFLVLSSHLRPFSIPGFTSGISTAVV